MPQPAERHLAVLRGLVQAQVGGPVESLAVVGNAPMSESASRADRIDAADAVVRMTTFEIDRDTPRAGRRTDVVVLHRATVAGPATWEDYRRRVYFVAEPGRRHYEPQRRTLWWPADAAPVPIPNRHVSDPLNRALGYRPAHAVWATTGTLTVWFVHLLFPAARVLLAGSSLLGRDAGKGHQLEHAWGPPTPLTPEHRLDVEAAALRRWRDEGWLQIAAADTDGEAA